MKATATKYTEPRLTIPRRGAFVGIVSYDIDNNYPKRVRDIVQNSSMGKACVSLYRKFIFGQGFSDRKFANVVINSVGLTWDKWLNKVCDNAAYHGGVCAHVNYNAFGGISEVNFQPFMHVRKTTEDHPEHPDMFAVSKWWHLRNIKPDQIIYIDKFNPDPSIIMDQVDRAGGWENYNGQIMYVPFQDEDEYPLSLFDAVLEDMQTDSQTKTFKFRNVTSNFMASHILTIDKTESADSPDASAPGTPATRETAAIVEQLEEFQGGENAMKFLVMEKSADQQVKLEKVDIQKVDNIFEWTESSTRENIRQAFLIPAPLLLTVSGKIGTSTEIIDAYSVYNKNTEDERLKISEMVALLYSKMAIFESGFSYEIEPKASVDSDDYKIIKDVLPDLTQNERRSVAGFDPLADPHANLQTLASKLTVPESNFLYQILTHPELPGEQMAGVLKLYFGLTEEQVKLIIKPNGTPTNTGSPNSTV